VENSLVESGYERQEAKVPAKEMSLEPVPNARLFPSAERLSIKRLKAFQPILAALWETVVASLGDPISCGLLSD
jgi:hypothetical protein